MNRSLTSAVRSGTNPLEIVVAPLVSLFDRRTRIAARFPLGSRPRERHIRAQQRDDRRRIADALGAEVPAGRRRQRHRHFGHANAGQLVAVGIDLRDEEGQRGELSR